MARNVLQAPVVHTNGTSADVLLEQLTEALNALANAADALRKCAPNGRDYYPLGPEALRLAEQQHFDRVASIQAVSSEIEELQMSVSNQEDEIQRSKLRR